MRRGPVHGGRLGLVVAVLVALGVLVSPADGLPGAGAARGAATDLTLVTDAVYSVRPADRKVSVSVAVDVRNRTRETKTRRFWFDHGFLAIQPGATNVRLSGRKGARARVTRRTDAATLVRLDFGARLYSGQRSRLRLTFDLPGAGEAASPQVRVGTGLVTLPVWAFASEGARGSTVTVRVPAGWEVAVESGELPRRQGGAEDGTVLGSGPIAAPLRWFAFVTAQQPATFVDRPVTLDVGGEPVDLVIRGWEDDPAWGTRVEGLLAEALPVLREEIGVPWPLEAPLVVEESASRDAGAAAARFDPAEGRMALAYWADRSVVVQQAAHGWFGGRLVPDRWVNEGFAAWYAGRAAERLGIEAEPPGMTEAAEAAAMPLNDWTSETEPGSPEDRYAAAAAYALAATLGERVGVDALAQAWSDLAAGAATYPAEPGTAPVVDPTAATATPRDWRGLLDVLEARTGEDLAPLWREEVVTADQAVLLDARAASRLSYERTLVLAGAWELPPTIRDALRAWDFPLADALLTDARTVIAQRNAVAATAEQQGLRLPDAMRPMFEGGDLAGASAQAESERAAMTFIADAAASRSAEDDILSRIGMIGEDPDTDLAAARTALASGDIGASRDASARAHRAWTAAWQEGRRRALLGLAALATVLVLGSAVIGNVRRVRRERRAADPPAAAAA